MIGLLFKSHQCLVEGTVCGRDWLNCHADPQEVGRCHTTDEQMLEHSYVKLVFIGNRVFGKLISKLCVPYLPISDRPTTGLPLVTLPKPPTAEEINTVHGLLLMKEQRDPGGKFLHDANLESTLPLLEPKLSTPILNICQISVGKAQC